MNENYDDNEIMNEDQNTVENTVNNDEIVEILPDNGSVTDDHTPAEPVQNTGYTYSQEVPVQSNEHIYAQQAPVQSNEYTYTQQAPVQNSDYSYTQQAPVQNSDYSYTQQAPVQNNYSYTQPAPVQNNDYSYNVQAPAQNGYAYAQQAPAQNSYTYSYGSGAPAEVNEGGYTSSYGTSYRQDPNSSKPKKSHMPTWLKVLISAAAFGIIAAAAFIGINAAYDALFPSTSPAVNEESAGKDHKIINNDNSGESAGNTTGSTVKKNDSDNAVASTQILTGNEVNFTDVSAVVENSMPSIVQINCTFNAQSFFGTYQSTGAGSGIIIGQNDDELLIATNNHVVENALDVKVTFNDNTEAEGYIKGTDAYADLAVVAVDVTKLDAETLNNIKIATIGDSDEVKVGQMAIAIGNALGYGTSVTVGYISAKDREVEVDGKQMTLLQTDAAINPGNSGGALLNIKGEVIGINSVKYASSDVEGMGFAIPISRAVDILNDLATREALKDEEKGYLGVHMSTVTSDFANAYGWPTGVYVNDVIEGSVAEEAGILAGDIITQINGRNVQTSTDLRNEITSYKAGTTVTITLQRLSRGRFKEVEIEVTLSSNPEYGD